MVRTLVILVFGVGWIASDANAASVAPHALFMDHHTRSAVFYVHNPSSVPTKITVELQYGFITADSTGTAQVELIPTPDPSAPSAAAWIRAYPPKMVLEPGQRQAVRLMAEPPTGLPDGEYWSRILVASEEIRTDVPSEASGVRIGLNAVMRTITSLNYRKGDVHTAVEVQSVQAQVEDDQLVTEFSLGRDGNAAYLGTVEVRLVDVFQQEVASWRRPIAVYHDTFRRMSWELPELDAGEYQAVVRFATDRSDLAASDVLPAQPVLTSRQVIVN